MKPAKQKLIQEWAGLCALRDMITFSGFQSLGLVNLGSLIKEVDVRIEKSKCKALA